MVRGRDRDRDRARLAGVGPGGNPSVCAMWTEARFGGGGCGGGGGRYYDYGDVVDGGYDYVRSLYPAVGRVRGFVGHCGGGGGAENLAGTRTAAYFATATVIATVIGSLSLIG